MQALKKQQGMATILLVLLIGITVMLITASVARALITKKEAATAAHAQTNAQILNWAGVAAFREFLIKEGNISIDNITSLQSQHPNGVPLRVTNPNDSSDDHLKSIIAKIIEVTNCDTATLTGGTPNCTVIADILANNTSSKAANTIRVVYKLVLENGVVTTFNENVNLGFTGTTRLEGVTISGEAPNSKATLNVDGTFSLFRLKTENISELTINSTGDVYIDCLNSQCLNTKININANGRVDLLNGGNYGKIYAKQEVSVTTNVKMDEIHSLDNVTLRGSRTRAGEIHSNKNVTLMSGANSGDIYANGQVSLSAGADANNIHANNNVTVSTGSAGNIKTLGDVDLNTGATVKDIHANGKVTSISGSQTNSIFAKGRVSLHHTTVNGDVETDRHLYMFSGEIKKVSGSKGNVKVGDYVQLLERATIHGSVYARGDRTLNAGVWPWDYESSFTSSTGRVYGDIYTKKTAYFWGADTLNGKVYYIDDKPRGAGSSGKEETKMNSIPALTFTVPSVSATPSITTRVTQHINGQLDFKTFINVIAYKNDANYIFTTNGQDKRVYLNHLKNKSNNLTYMYEEVRSGSNITSRKQYALDEDKNRIEYGSDGFHLAEYKIGSNIYIGAICAEINTDRTCRSPIIGYLPRFSLEKTILQSRRDYDYAGSDLLGSHTWYLRALTQKSDIENAIIAPGILYFEGSLNITGHDTNSLNNAYTNSLLAEGTINATAFRPTIYSPYNVLRSNTGASLICDRSVKTLSGVNVSTSTLNNTNTISNKYLMPINLCQDENNFSNNMHLDVNGNPIKVSIDDRMVDKIDLGFVALMANRDITLADCPTIYGDVYTRGYISYTSADPLYVGICNNNSGSIFGAVHSQGEYNNMNALTTMTSGSKIIIPKPGFSGSGKSDGTSTTVETGLKTTSLETTWARYQ
ncbi:hypothetical protein [Acinetobacter towneri]|uniref:hypothetical protein n=1 Tax=Acinetobacter towneri TaxID=202956 RepID=UPI003A83A11B